MLASGRLHNYEQGNSTSRSDIEKTQHMSDKDQKKTVDIEPDEDSADTAASAEEELVGDTELESGLELDTEREEGADDPWAAFERKSKEYDDLKDRHLRMVAEFDNFRKRTAKQMTDSGTAAQAFLITRLLDALDDLGRVADLDSEKTSAADVLSGIELVEKKIFKELEAVGLERVGVVGESFDPNQHEAVGTVALDGDAVEDTVATVLQMGYKVGATLLRPAMVQVYM